MKRNLDNKGVTLIELISAIAILSIVAISAFTLLMFSIRSNNVIVTGASAAQDADLLNKRLELCFEDASIPDSVVKDGNIDPESIVLKDGRKLQYEIDTAILSLVVAGSDDELLQDNLKDFQISRVEQTDLVRVSYTIGNRSFVKLFRVTFAEK